MKIQSRVRRLLQRQDLRDSDKKLLLAFWHTQGFELTEHQRKVFMERCATPESITRARRALREEYPASDSVENERFKKYMSYKHDRAYNR